MKGVEALQSIVFLTASIAAILVLIALMINFVEPDFGKDYTVKGEKDEVMQSLRNFIYRCWEENEGSLSNKICFKINLNSSVDITEKEILDKIDTKIISKDKVKIENITGPANLVIEYAKDIVSVENR